MEMFSFKLGMSLELSAVYLFLLEACPLLLNIGYGGNCMFSRLKVLLQKSDQGMGKSSFPESYKHLLKKG